MTMANLLPTAVALAVASQVYLSPIPEVSTVKVIASYFTANCLLVLYLVTLSFQSFHPATVVGSLFFANLVFLFTAISLTIVRRIYFSPLSRFPGPKFAAITKLWEANEFRLGRASLTHERLHAEYGSDSSGLDQTRFLSIMSKQWQKSLLVGTLEGHFMK
jgi:hypothetical protein